MTTTRKRRPAAPAKVPGADTLETTVETVTPEIAKEWLKKAEDDPNRPPNPRTIRNYARDMAAGAWLLDGGAIKFGTNGALLDGKQRMKAVIDSGATITTCVMRGLDPPSQSVMDTGRKRSAADDLAIRGETNTTMLAAVVKLSLGVDTGAADPYRIEPTHTEIRNHLEAHPNIRAACDFIRPLSRKTDCPATVAAYTYYVMAEIDVFEAANFWIALAEKIDLKAGDPVLALSNRFAEIRRGRQTLPKPVYMSLIYRAWNARRKGLEMAFIRVHSPGAGGGMVPVPKPI